MPTRSRTASAAAALRVAAAVCVLSTWSLCACAPVGDAGSVATTTEDDGLYRAPPTGEDGAYVPGSDQEQGADDEGAYVPEKYETDESAREGTYDAKKYEAVEGFDDGMYHQQPDLEAGDDGSYHPEIAEKTVGDDGSYRTENEKVAGDDGSYRPEEYERSEGDDGVYKPQLYETVVGEDGAYHPEIAENVVGDDGSYHPDTNLNGENHEGVYSPEIYEKVIGDDGSYRSTEEEDGSYHSSVDQEDDGLYHPEVHERSVSEEDGQGTPETQLQGDVYSTDSRRQTTAARVRREQSDVGFQPARAHNDSHSRSLDSEINSGEVTEPVTNKRSVGGADGGVYRLQTLEERMEQSDDGAYRPERYETPAPEASQDWGGPWTEGAAAPGATPTEAADDGSYRPEHHTAEDYDERADSGQSSATPPVEATEAADDGSYRLHQHTEAPAEDYDEGAENGTDWRDNVVEQHDEGTEAADDGSYRPLEHGPRDRRGASEDREEVQLSPVVFHVGPKPATDGGAKASGSVADDDAHAIAPQSAELPPPAAAV